MATRSKNTDTIETTDEIVTVPTDPPAAEEIVTPEEEARLDETLNEGDDERDELPEDEQRPETDAVEDLVTPYKAAKYINDQLGTEAGWVEIPPQMVYTYVKNGSLASTEVAGQKRVTLTDALEWGKKLVARRAERDTKKTEKAEKELAAKDQEVTEVE